MMQLEDFSSGYYRLSMQVEPYRNGPACSCGMFDYLNRECYGNTDTEPMFRLDMDGSPYFQVGCEQSIPEDVLGVPEQWFNDTSIERGYEPEYIFLLKPAHAYLLDDAMLTGEYPEDAVVDIDDDLGLNKTDFRDED